MELSISSYSYSRAYSDTFTLEDAIRHAKKTGFDGMEFLDGLSYKNYSALDAMRYYGDLARENGLKVYNVDSGINLLAEDFREQIQRGKDLIDRTEAIGAPCVRCDTLGGGFGTAANGGLRQAIKTIAEGIGEVADYAAEKGINLLVENHGIIMQDSIVVEELINTVARPNYGALVDIGNFLCADENPVEAVGRMTRYVKHVHLKDFHVKSGNEVFLARRGWFGSRGGNYLRGAILGHGNVPVYQCLRVLKNNGYNGAISLEFEGVEDCIYAIEASFEAMKAAQSLLG